jgi:adenylate kinase family enzyme
MRLKNFETMAGIRINLIGASGSGTSTVGRSLASALSLPHFESDDYFHATSDPPFQNPRPAEERFELIRRDLLPDASWVLSGGIGAWSPIPVLEFTCVVFLYIPTPLRVERLRIREQQRFGDRILNGGDMHKSHDEFIAWASDYDVGGIEGKTLAIHEAYLNAQSCRVLEFRDVITVADITEKVIQSISRSGEKT